MAQLLQLLLVDLLDHGLREVPVLPSLHQLQVVQWVLSVPVVKGYLITKMYQQLRKTLTFTIIYTAVFVPCSILFTFLLFACVLFTNLQK